jgi:hypothetical protein
VGHLQAFGVLRGFNQLLKETVRQCEMVKRFRIPPPPDPSQSRGNRIEIDLNSEDLAKAGQSLRGCELISLCEELWKQWLPFVHKTVDGSSDDPVAEVGTAWDAQSRREEVVNRLCPVLAFLYLGRRLGNFHATIVSPSEGSGEKYEEDGSKAAMSYALTELSDVIGEHQAEQVFRRLERETDALLKKTFGRPR